MRIEIKELNGSSELELLIFDGKLNDKLNGKLCYTLNKEDNKYERTYSKFLRGLTFADSLLVSKVVYAKYNIDIDLIKLVRDFNHYAFIVELDNERVLLDVNESIETIKENTILAGINMYEYLSTNYDRNIWIQDIIHRNASTLSYDDFDNSYVTAYMCRTDYERIYKNTLLDILSRGYINHIEPLNQLKYVASPAIRNPFELQILEHIEEFDDIGNNMLLKDGYYSYDSFKAQSNFRKLDFSVTIRNNKLILKGLHELQQKYVGRMCLLHFCGQELDINNKNYSRPILERFMENKGIKSITLDNEVRNTFPLKAKLIVDFYSDSVTYDLDMSLENIDYTIRDTSALEILDILEEEFISYE